MQLTKRQSMPVADVMTTSVITAPPDHALREIRKIFAERKCHHIPIVEDNRVIGMVSAHDLICLVTEEDTGGDAARILATGSARDVMSVDLETIHGLDPVEAAIDRIGIGDLHSLIVVDEQERLVGIVTHRDLLQYLTG